MDAVIFDMDGTLLDTEPLMDVFLIKSCRSLGFDLTQSILEQFRGCTSQAFWAYLVREFNLTQPVEEYVFQEKYAFSEELKNNPTLALIEGVEALIEELLKFEVPLAIASSASRLRIDTIVERFRMETKFRVKISGEDVERGKPEPDIFLLTAEKLNVDPSRCIVIEDSENGVKAAKKAGMKCVAFSGLEHNKQNLSSADLIVTAYSNLNFQVLQSLFEMEEKY
ncbi:MULTISPECIES: HAD family hydrolase [Nostocales]|uniref:HAD family phosphatase n=3 Tax=Nostocales TaxID=1161 RepID=A0A0C1R9X5_9CYAN|nr:HAD family phosphatase [Tolypothrix bouteillei]KAF3885192.1 HAD family phosphatase [Tolypothrix bouteillei VB521301]